MHFVSITRLRLRSWRFLLPFVVYAVRSQRQARKSEGCLGAEVRREAGNVFWTKTLWTDAAAMKAFRNRGAHQVAMRKLSEWTDEASYAHFSDQSPELPSWELAHERLLALGTLSKVKYPSPLQREGRAAPPLPDARR